MQPQLDLLVDAATACPVSGSNYTAGPICETSADAYVIPIRL